MFRWVNGRAPRQQGLEFGLWTRAVVVESIDKKFGIRLGLTAAGELPAKLGLTPQKPLQRAYQRDPQAIEKWQRETYPAIVKRANAEGAEIYFWDESGFRADTVRSTPAPSPSTAAPASPAQTARLSAQRSVWTGQAIQACHGVSAFIFLLTNPILT